MAKNNDNGKKSSKSIETITHDDAKRRNIPTAEFESLMRKDEKTPIQLAYERRNRDLDPQLVWRGKDEQDWSDLIVHAPPLYIQEKVHPKVLIDDLKKQTLEMEKKVVEAEQVDLFSDFNGLPSQEAKTEFYQHDSNWSNRMVLGDSLQVMASLAEREGLRGQVQAIYFDPPYGIKFNSNFQWSTTTQTVNDGNIKHITREPEQVKAFRDTWRDGIHSYLTYIRDRLTVARDLLTESGSIFVQIGDENVHRIRSLMDEIYGENNFVSLITYQKSTPLSTNLLPTTCDYIIWYSKNKECMKYRQPFIEKQAGEVGASRYKYIETADGKRLPVSEFKENGQSWRLFTDSDLSAQTLSASQAFHFNFQGNLFSPSNSRHWQTHLDGLNRLSNSNRIFRMGTRLRYVRYFDDFPVNPLNNIWTDIGGIQSRSDPKIYVVQTSTSTIQRCLLMTTDPGDLVLDPTCGSGTTAYVAEQWGRRWITIDTSRVSLALARARIMGARYPYYLLADSKDGQVKEGDITQKAPSTAPTNNNIRHGFVYERVPHITLKSIANNAEIDVIWEKFQQKLEPLREKLTTSLKKKLEEWEIPREVDTSAFDSAQASVVKKLHLEWWDLRIARQKEIDASIAAKAEYEYLYDKPYEDNKKVRVAGPFTVESLSPHRILAVDENDELVDEVRSPKSQFGQKQDFATMILENLKTAGVQQAHKEDKINFTSLTPWPGDLVCAEARYMESDEETGTERRAGIFIGPEFGTVAREDLVLAARECSDADFDVLIACAFSYEAHTTEFEKLGRIRVLKARMDADLHMAEDLKNTGKGNLFVIFGEPDIDILPAENKQIKVKINGVDVFHPNTGEIISDNADGIACWFVDTDYNEESFFVRHAYFLGAADPYKSLKTTLKAEINQEAWGTLHSDISRPFDRPKSGRIAVKVINHLGDEVMKVYKV